MKALNVLGIVFAWILSIALVIMLVAAPLLLSTLSVLETGNIVKAVGKSLLKEEKSAATNLEQDYAFQKLSVSSKENSLAESVLDALNMKDIEAIVGEKVDEKVVAKVLASDAVTGILEAYANDVANALTGASDDKQFTSKKIVELVEEHLDEVVEAVEAAGVSMTKDQKAEVKSKINSAVKENADKLVEALPAPEKIMGTLVEENEIVKVLATFIVKRNMFKGIVVGIIVVLSLLIFALRYPGFRGLRWLASDLFTAGGANVVLCLALGVGSSTIIGLTGGVGGTALDGVLGNILAQLTTGLVTRTAIMLVAAVVLLVAYHLLKKLAQKKLTKTVEVPPFAENEA